jgi:hypothetical protein
MRTLIDDCLQWLSVAPRHKRGLRALQIAIGAMLLYRVVTEGRFAAYLWGPRGLVGGANALRYPGWALTLLDESFGTMTRTYGLLVLLAMAGFCLILGFHTRVAAAVAVVVLWLIMLRLPGLFDGGDNIAMIALTYTVACISPDERVQERSVRVWIHNIGVLFIMTQLMILYFTSGIYKAAGDLWQNGTALYVIGQVETFSLPSLRALLLNPYLVVLATYGTVIYQIWFPMAMMNRFLKLPWLAAGMLLHMGIASFMGLVAFSTVMIGLELFMITDSEYELILARGKNAATLLRRLRLRLSARQNSVSDPAK